MKKTTAKKTTKKGKTVKKKPYQYKFLRPVGKPPAFKSPEDLRIQIDKYLTECKGKGRGWKEKPTKIGLALYLGVHRDTILSYFSEKGDEYSGTIKEAYGFIEKAWVTKLDEAYPTGGIFYLKNAFKDNYRDRYDHTNNGDTFQPTVVFYGDKDPLKTFLENQEKRKKQKENETKED